MSPAALYTKAKDPTHAVLGVDQEGETFSMCLSEGPHWLICGQTMSGKSVFVNQILMSLICHNTPDELEIVWIDPKKVEADAYVDLPFCPINPVTDMNDAFGLIAYYTWLMDERYKLLQKIRVKKIPEYNDWVEANPQQAEEMGLKKMPYIIIVIDEYADMKQTNPNVEDNIVRIGQKARAAGIHLMIATQRPSADVVTPLLRSNIPSRVGLKVTDSMNSQIIIGESGCENLKGFGDAIILDGMKGEMTRVQGPYITNEEIAAQFAYVREKYPKPEFFDYKQKCVDEGLCQWETEYTEDVPWEERHVVPIRRRPGAR